MHSQRNISVLSSPQKLRKCTHHTRALITHNGSPFRGLLAHADDLRSEVVLRDRRAVFHELKGVRAPTRSRSPVHVALGILCCRLLRSKDEINGRHRQQHIVDQRTYIYTHAHTHTHAHSRREKVSVSKEPSSPHTIESETMEKVRQRAPESHFFPCTNHRKSSASFFRRTQPSSYCPKWRDAPLGRSSWTSRTWRTTCPLRPRARARSPSLVLGLRLVAGASTRLLMAPEARTCGAAAAALFIFAVQDGAEVPRKDVTCEEVAGLYTQRGCSLLFFPLGLSMAHAEYLIGWTTRKHEKAISLAIAAPPFTSDLRGGSITAIYSVVREAAKRVEFLLSTMHCDLNSSCSSRAHGDENSARTGQEAHCIPSLLIQTHQQLCGLFRAD